MPQLTDDNLAQFVFELSEFLDAKTRDFEIDEDYEELTDFVFGHLEKFSNGYRNYN